jgi:virginiamycin B lyase
MKSPFRLAFATFALIGGLAPSAAHAVVIKEFAIPTVGASAEYIAPSLDGHVYFTEHWAGKIGKVDVFGIISEVSLPAGSKPLHIITGLDGAVWWLDDARHMLCSFTEEIPIPVGPGTVAPRGMTAALGSVWYVDFDQDVLHHVRWTSPGHWTGVGTGLPLPAHEGPYDVTLGSDRNIWFTEQVQNAIGRYDGASFSMWTIPTAHSGVTNLFAGRDGKIWFVETAGNKIGWILPSNTDGGIHEIDIPTAGAFPYDLVLGPDGNVWFTEYNVGKVGRVDMYGVIKEYALPSGPDSGPVGITAGYDGNLYVVEHIANKIARITPQLAGDANGDGDRDVVDVFYLINFLFASGPAPTY